MFSYYGSKSKIVDYYPPPKHKKIIEPFAGSASNHIWSAIDGGNGLLYIGHVDRGFSILSIKDKTVKNFTHEPQNPNSLPGNEVTCVYKDKSGNIWIGTDRGVVLFNPEAESFIPFDDKTNCISHRVYDIHQLDDNRLWIAMEFGRHYQNHCRLRR